MGQGTIACMRYILCGFTLVFVIFGGILIYTGLSTFLSLKEFHPVVHNGPNGATIVLLVLGGVIFFISFLGCCGAITGNDFMLRTFAFVLTLLLLIEVISVVFVFTFKKTIHQSMESGIEEAIRKYNTTDSHSAINSMIDDVQSRFACCGANGPADWRNNTMMPNGDLPLSCCPIGLDSCTMNIPDHYRKGCVDIITDELKNSVNYLETAAIIVIVLEVIGVIFACTLSGRRGQYSHV